jgi:diaminopimelate epimerase
MIISSFKNNFLIKFVGKLDNINLDDINSKVNKYKIDGIILLNYIQISKFENKKLYIKAGYDLYNIDLTRAEVSGNGLACLAKFINYSFRFDKLFTNIYFNFLSTFFNKEFKLEYKDKYYFVEFDSNKFEFIENIIKNCHYVNVGNPHIIFIPDNNFKNLKTFGNKFIFNFLENLYKDVVKNLGFETNVHFVFRKKNDYYIYSYERGVGITKSCGSGSIASFYLLNKLNIVNSNNFILKSLGGDIALKKNNNFYYLKSLPKIIKKTNF